MIQTQHHQPRSRKSSMRDLARLLEYDLVKSQWRFKKAAIAAKLTLRLLLKPRTVAKLTPVKKTALSSPFLLTFFNGFFYAHR